MAEQEPSRQPQVFISYARPDETQARSLVEALTKLGINVRFDQSEIRYGDNAILWMNNALAESDYLLLLLSGATAGRYWVETEWAAGLAKDAELRRTFLIPVVLPDTDDTDIPALLKAKRYVDLRRDAEKELLRLVAQIKSDAVIARDLGSYPIPAPAALADRCEAQLTPGAEMITVFVHSNRFARVMRLRVPQSAGAGFVLTAVREELGLPFSMIDDKLQLELSYEYYLRFRGQRLTTQTLAEQDVRDGARLELWIRLVWRDLVANRTLSKNTVAFLTTMRVATRLDPGARLGATGRLAEGELADRASPSFDHVDR
ncbi:MAG: toll/interleukin-1 receptor domain-containing protein [Deltaproteobacteria bacterium]|nr:toll/interleukin-1 receptor domain-containing protein [Deltaproteobacteria bacterium]MBI3386743.1 toll/interleukin-1 receptor domain-containing protein [Deltaproteobacteria bacterium]